jgi:hypothetical protein
MVPRDVMIVPRLPMLGTGKVDYPSVQALAVSRETTAEPAQAAAIV